MPRGLHVCSFARTFREQFAIAVPFLRAGLEARRRCLFVTDDNTPDVVRAELLAFGLDPRMVSVVSSAETPLRAEALQPEKLHAAWRRATEQALADGYQGLSVVVEMTWALSVRADALAAYEREAGPLFEDLPLHALCQYNRIRFPVETLRGAGLEGHRHVLTERGFLDATLADEDLASDPLA